MLNAQTNIEWEKTARDKYTRMIARIPLFHREIARQVVDKKAVLNAHDRGSTQVEEADIVQAFLTEVPKAFYSLMIRIFDEVGFDYRLARGVNAKAVEAGKDA